MSFPVHLASMMVPGISPNYLCHQKGCAGCLERTRQSGWSPLRSCTLCPGFQGKGAAERSQAFQARPLSCFQPMPCPTALPAAADAARSSQNFNFHRFKPASAHLESASPAVSSTAGGVMSSAREWRWTITAWTVSPMSKPGDGGCYLADSSPDWEKQTASEI